MIQPELNLEPSIVNSKPVYTSPCFAVEPVRNSAHIESRALRELVGLLQGSSHTNNFKS